MNSSPADHAPLRDKLIPPLSGSNLGQPRANPRLAHSLFSQSPQQRVTDHSDPHKAVVLPPAALAGAATNRRCYPAESRPSPFIEIYNFTHQYLLHAETTGTAIPFDGNIIREDRNGHFG